MSPVEYISISSLSAIHWALARHLIVAIQAYCDGSGKTNDPSAHYLTLAGVIAAPRDWTEFEDQWASVLDRHHSPPWHSTDAHALRDDFVDWTHERVLMLKADLFNTCFSGVAIPRGFVCATSTVGLRDYERAASQLQTIRDAPPEAICAFSVAGAALHSLPDNPAAPFQEEGLLELFFDRGESFLGHIQKEWEARKKNRWSDIVSRIASIVPVDYRHVIGIQAADLVAWHTNRGYAKDDKEASFYPRMAVRFLQQKYWDYDGLIEWFTEKPS